jgi:hypothetical protein
VGSLLEIKHRVDFIQVGYEFCTSLLLIVFLLREVIGWISYKTATKFIKVFGKFLEIKHRVDFIQVGYEFRQSILLFSLLLFGNYRVDFF